MVDISEDDYMMHIGIRRESGRYPWGSGGDPYQRAVGMKSWLDDAKAAGMTEQDMLKALSDYAGHPVKSTDLRAGISSSTEEIRAYNKSMATSPKDKGLSNGAIAERMGLGGGKSAESTVRGWLKTSDEVKAGTLRATSDKLREEVANKPFLDVGAGTHLYAGISSTKLNTALAVLRDEGYNVYQIKAPQLGTEHLTTYKILCKEGVSFKEARDAVFAGQHQVFASQTDDGGLSYFTPKAEPVSISSKRIEVRYGDKGKEMDGVIELRRTAEDLNMGQSRYAQVRVAVDGTHYLKGMAIYADDLPDGVDVRFNTPKADTGNKLDAMKPMAMKDGAVDKENPFKASTYPKTYIDSKGVKKTSPLNIVNEEGDWDKWSKNLSSQMLSKQPVALASRQLGKAKSDQEEELKAIMSLTNPVVKKKLLDSFADNADSAAVHLKAAALPRQATRVLLPVTSMRPHEVYAPGFENGEKVVLVRHPHGGPFEIPDLTVNNKNLTAKRIMGDARDAIAIHPKVAAQLSGADFDGDAVLVIPNSNGAVKTRSPLPGLDGFDAKAVYPGHEGMVKMTKKNTQSEMGKISNLITDMTIHNANDDELARAIRHSMVVIDAEKHGLDYKLSEKRNNIAQLKEKYQGAKNKGASTIISRASSDQRINQIKARPHAEGGPVNKKTGELEFVPTGKSFTRTITKVNKRTGEVITKTEEVFNTTKGTRMEFAKDARELLSGTGPLSQRGTPMERVYADYANSMKQMANAARKESVNMTMPRVSKAAQAVYHKEAKELDAALKIAQMNAPRERKAQALGNALAKARIDGDPTLDKDDIKKIKFQSLERARLLTGAAKDRIVITDRQWEAIQAGAIPHSKLSEILTNADSERVRTLATPRTRTSLTTGQLARAQSMLNSGKDMSAIADSLGIPRSTLIDNLSR